MRLAALAALLLAGALAFALSLRELAHVTGGDAALAPRVPAHAIATNACPSEPPETPETDLAPSASPALTR